MLTVGSSLVPTPVVRSEKEKCFKFLAKYSLQQPEIIQERQLEAEGQEARDQTEAQGEEDVEHLAGGHHHHLPRPVHQGPGGVPGEDHEDLQQAGRHQAEHRGAAVIEDRQAQILFPAHLS